MPLKRKEPEPSDVAIVLYTCSSLRSVSPAALSPAPAGSRTVPCTTPLPEVSRTSRTAAEDPAVRSISWVCGAKQGASTVTV